MSAAISVGDVSRDGPDGRRGRLCPVCGSQVMSRRARFCSGRCRMRAHRWRHPQPDPAIRPVDTTRSLLPQVYECSGCDQRYLDVRRCPDCNLFARRLGPGGPCPHCEEPVLLAELLGPTAP